MTSTRTGFRGFVVLWAGQSASLAGSALSSFALGVYAYLHTGSVTTLGSVYALAFLPFLVASPFAGSLVDRWGPHRSLVVSNAAAAATMLVLATTIWADGFALWQIYVVVSLISVTESLQTPAFESAIPAIVTTEQLGRASGMGMLAIAVSRLFAPVGGGVLLLSVHLSGIVVLDCVSYLLALLSLAAVRFAATPDPTARPMTPAGLLSDFVGSARVIAGHRGLVALLVLTVVINFCGGFVQLLITPLVLAFGSTASLGVIMSVAGVGMVVAGVAMSVWSGTRHRVDVLLAFAGLMGVAMVVGGTRPNGVVIAAAAFVVMGCSAVVMSCNQVLWQARIEQRMMGRVTALLTITFAAPELVAFALSGVTADRVFTPIVGRTDVESPFLRLLVGDGPGRGFALLIMVMGVLITLCALVAARWPSLRELDRTPADVGSPPPVPVAARAAPEPGALTAHEART